MKTFFLGGTIIDTDEDRVTYEDVTPAQINAFAKTLDPNEELQLDISSPGGSVTAGLAIVNLLRKLNSNGHKTTANIVGCAASMASVIACACNRLIFPKASLMMIHLPWTVAMGNSIDLRKEADTLDVFKQTLISVYQSKFNCTRDQIEQMMADETWITGEYASSMGLECEVPDESLPFRAAACMTNIPKFNKMPNNVDKIFILGHILEQEDTQMDKIEDVKAEEVDNTTEEVVEETSVAEETTEVVEVEKTEDMVPKAEVDKRVSGMQSTMQNKINALIKEHSQKIQDFESQLKIKDEELVKVKAEATSLASDLEKAKAELSKTVSALCEKTTALDKLNASVLATPQGNNVDWRKLKGKEFLDYVNANKDKLTKGNN